jgi:hypothetical protein
MARIDDPSYDRVDKDEQDRSKPDDYRPVSRRFATGPRFLQELRHCYRRSGHGPITPTVLSWLMVTTPRL